MTNQNRNVKPLSKEAWEVFHDHMVDPSCDEVVLMDDGTLMVSEGVDVEQLKAELQKFGISITDEQLLLCG